MDNEKTVDNTNDTVLDKPADSESKSTGENNKKAADKNLKKPSVKKKLNLKIIAVAIAAGIIVYLLSSKNIFSSLDFYISDMIHQPDNNPTLPIVIVGIDEKTIDGFKEQYGPVANWPRDLYARVIENLNTCG
ncbi:MAG: CHASE2 domain-containing protein, partial [Lachnospiraceae bacterium]|nr:CHASE2 domain-containing protein [Lachnospiraceae bacterium]